MSCKQSVSIGELITFSRGGGWGKDYEFNDSIRVAVVRGADFPSIEQGRFIGLPIRYEKRTKVRSVALRPGDVVLENSGGTDNRPTGRTLLISQKLLDSYDCPVIPASFCRLLRFEVENVDSIYMYYWLQDMYKSGRTWGYQNRSTGISNFQFKIFSDQELVSLPSFEEQKRIVDTLLIIDRKRIINSLINDYLGELCDALFCKFIDSQDDTWHKGTLDELLDIKYGKDHKKLADGPYPVYGSGGYMRSVERPLASSESVLIPRKGTLNNVMYVNEEFWTVDTMFYSIPRVPGAAKYAFQYIKKLDLASMNSGSAVPSMTTAILNALQLPIPNQNTLIELDNKLQPMYALAAANREEVKQLVFLRDTLLPKLMSGEIDVSGVLLNE